MSFLQRMHKENRFGQTETPLNPFLLRAKRRHAPSAISKVQCEALAATCVHSDMKSEDGVITNLVIGNPDSHGDIYASYSIANVVTIMSLRGQGNMIGNLAADGMVNGLKLRGNSMAISTTPYPGGCHSSSVCLISGISEYCQASVRKSDEDITDINIDDSTIMTCGESLHFYDRERFTSAPIRTHKTDGIGSAMTVCSGEDPTVYTGHRHGGVYSWDVRTKSRRSLMHGKVAVDTVGMLDEYSIVTRHVDGEVAVCDTRVPKSEGVKKCRVDISPPPA
eukprot:GHVO01050561.1.p1 GENE.GHVO01050561.1~~GHVO01050561.1.p1  ORF type:complete len:279 (-),score=33.28 GHVO01050561.1:186-1022(-)